MDDHQHSVSSFSVAALRRELRERGVAVWKAAEGRFQPIPVALTPTVVNASEWRCLVDDARTLLGTFTRLMDWLQRPQQEKIFARIFGGLRGLEAIAATQEASRNWGHATTRVDLFWHRGQIKIIEVNATIPAMQAYSDQTTRAWLASGAVLDPDQYMISDNQGDLLRGLLALYRRDGGCASRPQIAILHRSGDSQRGELESLCRDWTARGYPTELATPEHLSRVGDLWFVRGQPCDVVYRHIFAWRLEDPLILNALHHPQTAHIYNPVSAHYETKAFLAMVSEVADDDQLTAAVRLTSAEVAVIRKRVPWSRVILSEDAVKAMSWLEPRLDKLVLKRSLGYGGHHVIMGDAWHEAPTQSQLSSLLQCQTPVTLQDFVTWLARQDDSVWIAQERMSGVRRMTEVLTDSGVETWNAWYDASVFINTGTNFLSGGGVSRVAKTPVVNIGTGGGLAPFILDHGPKVKTR